MTDENSHPDFWPTPAAVADAGAEILYQLGDEVILDPSCGRGSLLEACSKKGMDVYGIERELTLANGAKASPLIDHTHVFVNDWLAFKTSGWRDQYRLGGLWDRVDAIYTNPPYSPARRMLAHVMTAIDVMNNLQTSVRHVLALLPLTFLASVARRPFHDEHPLTGLFPFSKRPSFGGGVGKRDVAFFLWSFSGPVALDRHMNGLLEFRLL